MSCCKVDYVRFNMTASDEDYNDFHWVDHQTFY